MRRNRWGPWPTCATATAALCWPSVRRDSCRAWGQWAERHSLPGHPAILHQMIGMKHFILATVIMKSIFLLHYQEDRKMLSLRSQDTKPTEGYCMDFTEDDVQLGFRVSPWVQNIIYLWDVHIPVGSPEEFPGHVLAVVGRMLERHPCEHAL